MEFSKNSYIIIPLLQAFEWFDEGLQRSLKARGWPVLTRTESMVMIHVILDIIRPSEIARCLGLSRQTIHTTISNIVDKGLFELKDDPSDKRAKIVCLTELGNNMRHDARHIADLIYAELAKRVGEDQLSALAKALGSDWGTPPSYGKNDQILN